jgi:hypothetical protein
MRASHTFAARLSVLIGAVVSACSGSHDAAAAADTRPTGTVAPTKATAPSVGRPAAIAAVDTSPPRLIPGRTKHDSVAFASTVALGEKMMRKWPAPPEPLSGSVLPAHRIVAFYGNPLAKNMGVLGQFPVDEMLAKLDQTVAEWRQADPATLVQPALQLIAVVAQGSAGKDGRYRLRMDTALIEKVYGWAQRTNALLFLDVQVGRSTMQQELPRLMPFLARPDVHLAMDAEFSMHHAAEGDVPGKRIGQFDAADVNWVAEQLTQLVTERRLPPKVLVVHRYTKPMISNASNIAVDPRVQIVMDMDGWGPPWMKFESYRDYIVNEPVEFTGFKLFFRNDVKKGHALLTPAEVLRLRPRPLYIQYQ